MKQKNSWQTAISNPVYPVYNGQWGHRVDFDNPIDFFHYKYISMIWTCQHICPLFLFKFSGETCSVRINECQDRPCWNGGTCEEDLSGFKCNCPFGKHLYFLYNCYIGIVWKSHICYSNALKSCTMQAFCLHFEMYRASYLD